LQIAKLRLQIGREICNLQSAICNYEGLSPMKLSAHRLAVLPTFLALLLSSPSPAATPRDELLRLVPEGVGFCLVVQDLRGHLERLQASSFMDSFRRSPLGKGLQTAEETRKLLSLAEALQKKLDLDFDRLRNEVFGDAVVLADHPGTADKPADRYDLLLLRARDPQVLADLIDKLNRYQEKQGELKKLEEREYRGQKYWRREEAHHDVYYLLKGPILVVASQEAGLQRAVDRDLQTSAEEETPVVRQLRLHGADKALLALWINPRAYDADLQKRTGQAGEAEATVLKTFAGYWQALDSLVVTAGWRKEFEATLSVRADVKRLPEAARRYLAEACRPSDVSGRFPDDALLTATGRVDLGALVEVIGGFLSPDEREALGKNLQRTLGASLGKDLTGEVLPALGPDWGLCVTAPPRGDKRWFPHVILAVRAGPGPKKDAPVDEALLLALHSYAMLAVVGHNSQHKDPREQMSLESVWQDKVKVHYLACNSFPAGLQPAFALSNGYLVLASSPEAVRRFGAASRSVPAAEEFSILRLSLGELREYLKEHRAELAKAVAEKNQLTQEEAERRLDGLLAGLQWVDRLEVTLRPGAGQVTWTMRVRLAQPLEK
jgi:hypothetical protein